MTTPYDDAAGPRLLATYLPGFLAGLSTHHTTPEGLTHA